MNTQTAQPSRTMRVVKSKWSWSSLLIILIAAYIVLRVLSAIESLNYALSPAELPEYTQLETKLVNPTGWKNQSSEWFHHASQGTATIPIPYSWFVALEEPKSSPWWVFIGEKKPYVSEYILRMGFIKQDKTTYNPDALPIGIAKTTSIFFPGIERQAEAAGFTCAACHTGQITYGDTRYVVDGGPSMIDLGLFTQTLGAALGQTALSSKFSLFDGRFDRFARKVLGGSYNVLNKSKLKDQLGKTIGLLATTGDVIDVTEGFTRLDALNRIGNQVFKVDMDRPSNYSPITAPVNFPHIWTTSWFDWVQYDASIMQPLIRNTGEALGVKASLDTTGPDAQRFASSANIRNLVKMEDWLAGKHPRQNGNKFNGLLAPKWPDGLPAIDNALAQKGGDLYQSMCQGCHLPAISPQSAFWSDKYWEKIKYYQDGQAMETVDDYLTLKVLPLKVIGTDPAQAGVLGERTIDTTGLNLDTEVCTLVSSDFVAEEGNSYPRGKVLSYVPLKDSATSTFGLALGAVVERTNQQWFNQNYIPAEQRLIDEGMRPNCLQVGLGYKARPLNGVWATAPFLHNGSVANVYDLLSTQAERPTFVQLGNQAFDAKHLGIVQNDDVKSLNAAKKHGSPELTDDYSDGLFILDTREAGNHNTGHIFDDAKQPGKIGRKLADDEKLAIIEYLKTL